MADNDIQLKDYSDTPITFKPRTRDRGSNVRENVNSLALDDGTLVSKTNPLPTNLPADQDPIFDHTNGVKVTTLATTSTLLITPPAGCKYIRINSDVDVFVNTANGAAGDVASSIKVMAANPELIPVVAGVNVNIYTLTAAVVRATPMKVR
jgi:hypothetical protein